MCIYSLALRSDYDRQAILCIVYLLALHLKS